MRSRWVSYLREFYCYHLSHRESNISSSTLTQHPSEWGEQALMHETAPLPCLDACVCLWMIKLWMHYCAALDVYYHPCTITWLCIQLLHTRPAGEHNLCISKNSVPLFSQSGLSHSFSLTRYPEQREDREEDSGYWKMQEGRKKYFHWPGPQMQENSGSLTQVRGIGDHYKLKNVLRYFASFQLLR